MTVSVALDIPIRIVSGVLGLGILYVSFFLYEDEQGGLQNLLEKIWVSIDDYGHGPIDRTSALLVATAAISKRVLDRVFGPKMFSLQAIAVSFFLGSLSFDIYGALFLSDGLMTWPMFLKGAALPVLWTFLPAIFQRRWAVYVTNSLFVACMVLLGGLMVYIRFWDPQRWRPESLYDPFFMSLPISILMTIVTVALNRRLISLDADVPASKKRAWMIVGLNAMVLVVLLGGNALYFSGSLPARLDLGIPGLIVTYLAFAGNLNFGAALCCSAVIGSMIIALSHRVFWPILGRSVYAIAQHGLVKIQSFWAPLGLVFWPLRYPSNGFFTIWGYTFKLKSNNMGDERSETIFTS